jgi:2-succinyl-5-enolpyruvyl-6-hydroxy-3-cyclohexene-1-carboxylate synthase
MKTSNKKIAQILANELVSAGFEHVVFSPGSRSAPIVMAINAMEKIQKHVVLDERSAAFFALGLAIETKKSVAIVCTSGSASVNYFPAITEAYYQGIPLFVITADRPVLRVNQGDGQTIMQAKIYGKHVRFATEIEDIDESDNYLFTVKNNIRKAISFCDAGPVHVNVHFSEPLYDQVEIDLNTWSEKMNIEQNVFQIDRAILEKWNAATSKMIVIGQLQPCRETEALLMELVTDTSVAILCENISNQNDWKFVTSIERAFTQIKNEQHFVPEFLLVLGSSFVSKKLKAFLRSKDIKTTVIVDQIMEKANTFECNSPYFVNVTSLTFLRNFKPDSDQMNPSNFGSKWKQLDYFAQEKQESILAQIPYCDLKAVERLITNLPENTNFSIGNSSIIRYSQLFTGIKNVNYRSNRGVAGIDGSLSTAVGQAFAKKEKLNIVVLGDLSFLYDINALLNHYLSPNLRIVVINNGGGSIFGMISGPKSTEVFDQFFKAKQNAKIDKLCEAFTIDYRKTIRLEDLDPAFEALFGDESEVPILLEIDTTVVNNEDLFVRYKNLMTN